jgi:hypothetical protein
MRGTSGPLRRMRTPAALPCLDGTRYGEARSLWSHGGQSSSAPSLKVRREATTPRPNLVPSPLLDDPPLRPIVMLRRKYSSRSFRHSRYSSSQGCAPPFRRLLLPDLGLCGRRRTGRRLRRRIAPGFPRSHTPSRGITASNVGLAIRRTSPAPRSDPQYGRLPSPSSYPLSPTGKPADVACHYCIYPPYLLRPSVVNTTFGPSTNCCHFSEYIPS